MHDDMRSLLRSIREYTNSYLGVGPASSPVVHTPHKYLMNRDTSRPSVVEHALSTPVLYMSSVRHRATMRKCPLVIWEKVRLDRWIEGQRTN
jgi:hypothetical protein